MLSICHCGAQAGYPHTPDCPFPLYHDAPAMVKAWNEERQRIRTSVHRYRYICQFQHTKDGDFVDDWSFDDLASARKRIALVMASQPYVKGRVYNQVLKRAV